MTPTSRLAYACGTAFALSRSFSVLPYVMYKLNASNRQAVWDHCSMVPSQFSTVSHELCEAVVHPPGIHEKYSTA